MSANTNISEGGKGRPFGPVKALMVEGEDGKFYSWYPESEKALGTLSVDKNGVYRASDKGVYGWSQVYVNVATTDHVTGKDPDTGEEVVVRPDPETGEITETVVPVEIRVIEPPTNPYGTYVDGQTITKDGMVVKAYGANGDEMMTVPIGEITLNPDKAVYDESKDRPAHGTATSDLATGLVQPIAYAKTVTSSNPTFEPPFMEWISAEACAGYVINPGSIQVLFASSHQPAAHRTSSSGLDIDVNGDSYTYDGKTVYYGRVSFSVSGDWVCDAPVNATTNDSMLAAAWTMIYGNRQEEPAGSPQTITVSWPRPGDGAILETTFDINVGPRGGSGED